MMSILVSLGFGVSAALLDTSSLVATEVLRSGDVITSANARAEGDIDAAQSLFGREVKRTVYPGQAIQPTNTQIKRMVRRNQIVSVKYQAGALEIVISARALGEAGIGETVEVMNTKSRKVITGTVTKDGWILAQ